MGSAIEIIDGRSVAFNEGAVDATRVFVLADYPSEDVVIFDVFGSRVEKTGDSSTQVAVPRVGEPHNVFPDILFCYSYNLTQLPGEHNLWRAEFRYRRTPALPFGGVNVPNAPVGTGPADVGFRELSARVSGSFTEAYRADPTNFEGDFDGDIGGVPVDRAGVPTSILRQQMEIIVSETVTNFDPGFFAKFVGTRTSEPLFNVPRGQLLYRGANISRIETNKFTVQHTWLYDVHFHLIQEPEYTIDGAPVLGKSEDQYRGKAFRVFFEQPFQFGDSHTLAPGF